MARVSAERRAEWRRLNDAHAFTPSVDEIADLLADLADAEERAERAEEALSRIADWTREHGAALKPAGSADTFGDGMREAKRQVGQMVTATRRGRM